MIMYFCMDVRMHVRFFFDAQKWNGILNIPKKSLRSTFETLKSLIRPVKLKIHSYTRRSIYMCDVSNETLPQHTDQESDTHIYHTLRHHHILNFTGKLAILLSKKTPSTVKRHPQAGAHRRKDPAIAHRPRICPIYLSYPQISSYAQIYREAFLITEQNKLHHESLIISFVVKGRGPVGDS